MTRPPLRVLNSGADTIILTSLCSRCPHGPKGCCVVPPRLALADIARIVHHDGRAWLQGEVAAGRIVAKGSFMILTRPAGACVYLGDEGCTITHEKRPATCNFYVCEQAVDGGDDTADAARQTRDRLERELAQRDADLLALLSQRAPNGIAFDEETLVFLGTEHARHAGP